MLVIGYGSIGSRHARILSQLGCDTAVLSNRDVSFDCVYHSLDDAINKHKPGYIVIANQTHKHYDTLTYLAEADFSGRVLIEKPIFEKSRLLPTANFEYIAVAYNLRFHQLIQKLSSLTTKKRYCLCMHMLGNIFLIGDLTKIIGDPILQCVVKVVVF